MALDGREFRLNRAQAQHSAMGGAIAALDSAQATRCLFLANSLESPIEEQGTAILGLVDLEHCTLTGNAGGSTGSTVAGSGALHNSILWNNVPSGFEAGASLAWCLNDGPDGGPSVSNLDPRFWSAEDATLMPSSPAIDAGDPASALDADGTAADLGWRPFDAIYCGAGCDGDLGTIYCASNPNSRGLQGRLGALGSATVAGDLLILVASDLPYGAPGYFLGSTGTDFVANFGGSMGNLCLGDPRILRFHASIQNSGPSGRVAQQLSLSDWPEGGVVQAGETWHFQFWHRDFDGITPTSNTTEALAIAY
ncbi:MAG: hypothetical protein R3F17_15935 [Planctomycetota bacterium]